MAAESSTPHGVQTSTEAGKEKQEVQAEAWADEVMGLLERECPHKKRGGRWEKAREERSRRRRERQREILKQAHLNNFRENVMEAIERQEEWCKTHDKPPISMDERAQRVRGYAFEQLAIASLPEEEHQYPELEEFILSALKDPDLWRATFYDTESLTPDELELYEKYLEARPREEELRYLQNNDAISVRIKKDEETGQPVALITGVVEAKNYPLRTKGRAVRQAELAPQILIKVVDRFKESFPLLVRYLGLSGELPEKIDIVDRRNLRYAIVQPSDVEPPSKKVRARYYPGCKFEKIPFTQKEAAVIASTIMPEARGDF